MTWCAHRRGGIGAQRGAQQDKDAAAARADRGGAEAASASRAIRGQTMALTLEIVPVMIIIIVFAAFSLWCAILAP
jgi:hypothetical protein